MNLEACIAGIDVHKSMLAVVVAPAPVPAQEPSEGWMRRKFGTTVQELNHLAAWLKERGVNEVVMESTAMYWRPVWLELEVHGFKQHLAQAQSNKAPHGRKTDFGDAERLIKRLRADELRLSFVVDQEQREWRMLCRRIDQINEDRTRVRNQIEILLEASRIKLSVVVSDLLGASSWQILKGLVEGTKSAAELAQMAMGKLRVKIPKLEQALAGSLSKNCRKLLSQALEQIEQLNKQEAEVTKLLSDAMNGHQQVLSRLGEMPGLNIRSAQKILAAIGPEAKTFHSSEHLASWAGMCPGRNESAERSMGEGCPKGYRPLRSILVQCAWAAAHTKNSYFQAKFKNWVARLGPQKAIFAVAHKMLKVIWCIVHRGDTYVERGVLTDEVSKQRKKKRLLQQLRILGYDVIITPKNPIPTPSQIQGLTV